jgi:acid phosphatase type 7
MRKTDFMIVTLIVWLGGACSLIKDDSSKSEDQTDANGGNNNGGNNNGGNNNGGDGDCVPVTCAMLPEGTCGVKSDDCGGTIDCGPCDDGGGVTEHLVVAAGDIAGTWSADGDTATLIESINPEAVLLLGDNVYGSGSPSQFRDYYEPTWGRHKTKTFPSPGNHDHDTDNLAGYCGYFGAAAHCTGGYSYYSFDLGNWHIISLDSGCSSPSNCPNPMATGSAMRTWLTSDLAANTKPCTLAYWHHPRFSSGGHGNDTRSEAIWQELQAHGAELVLNGHDHNYERFVAQTPTGTADPNGIVQFTVGTGGAGLRSIENRKPTSAVYDSSSWGVLKLMLRASSVDWEFVPIAGDTFTEKGTIACR